MQHEKRHRKDDGCHYSRSEVNPLDYRLHDASDQGSTDDEKQGWCGWAAVMSIHGLHDVLRAVLRLRGIVGGSHLHSLPDTKFGGRLHLFTKLLDVR